MTIGTNLFARLNSDSFARMQTQISSLQSRIAAGTNDPRPSADPMRAMQLSAGQELSARIDRFSANATAASERLGLTDTVLGEVSDIVRNMKDLALRAGNGSQTEASRAGLRIEAEALRDALFTAANRRDARGQPLFAGHATGDAFTRGPDGVTFTGDAGRSALRISESLVLPTSLNGADVFRAGSRDLFSAMDDLVAFLTPTMLRASDAMTAAGSADLAFSQTVRGQEVSLRLTGPNGQAQITATILGDAPDAMVAAVNAASGDTGVTATIAPDGTSLRFSVAGDTEFSIAEVSVAGGMRGPVGYLSRGSGPEANRAPQPLMTKDQSMNAIMDAFDSAVDNMAAQRAEAGALAASAERQFDILAARKVSVTNMIGNLEELDIAKAVTELQSLLTTQEAAQQTYVRITRSNLFEYLR